MVNAGLHCSFKMSRQMLPLLLMFGWKTLVLKATCRTQTCKLEKRSKQEPFHFIITLLGTSPGRLVVVCVLCSKTNERWKIVFIYSETHVPRIKVIFSLRKDLHTIICNQTKLAPVRPSKNKSIVFGKINEQVYMRYISLIFR